MNVEHKEKDNQKMFPLLNGVEWEEFTNADWGFGNGVMSNRLRVPPFR